MANVSHITVSGTTYDIVSAGSPFAAYTQMRLPTELQTINASTTRIVKAAYCSTYFVAQFCYSSISYATYKTTDFKTWTKITMPATGAIYSIAISDNGTYWAVHFSGSTIYVSRNGGSSFTAVTAAGNVYTVYGLTVSDDGYVVYSAGSSNNYRLYGINTSNTAFSFTGSPYGGYLGKILKINNRYCFSCKRGPSADTPTIYVSSTTGSLTTSTQFYYVDTPYILCGAISTTGYCAYINTGSRYYGQFVPSSSGGTVTALSTVPCSTSLMSPYDSRDNVAFTSDGLIITMGLQSEGSYSAAPRIVCLYKDKIGEPYFMQGPSSVYGPYMICVINNKIYAITYSYPPMAHMVDKDSFIYIPGII